MKIDCKQRRGQRHARTISLAVIIIAQFCLLNLDFHMTTSIQSPCGEELGDTKLLSLLPSKHIIPRVFVVSETTSGGSRKYINDLTRLYSAYGLEFVKLPNQQSIEKYVHKFRPGDILLFAYLFNTDFTFDIVLELVEKYQLRLIVPIHDRYFFGNSTESGIWVHSKEAETDLPSVNRRFLERAEYLIFPSKHIFNLFRNKLKLDSLRIIPHIDIITPVRNCQPNIVNGTVNIGVIAELSPTKGIDLVEEVIQNSTERQACASTILFHLYSDRVLDFGNSIIHGTYQETSVLESVVEHNIHGLLFLNNFPETFSFALSKGFYSGLPILYSGMGAVKERILERIALGANSEMFVETNNADLLDKFAAFVNVICSGQFVPSKKCVGLEHQLIPYKISDAYDEMLFTSAKVFMNQMEKIMSTFAHQYSMIHQQILPFAIYFPQFHEVPENDANFYPGYTDMINLQNLKARDTSLWTPLRNVLGFYDLVRDKEVIPRQIKIAKSFGFAGFMIYYYWFSNNTVTNQHQIFEKVINRFFEEEIDGFSIYFAWCNEDWTSNAAFQSGKSHEVIGNTLDLDSVNENLQYLLPYFKHNNYLKIENCPVLFIHHPQFFDKEELFIFKTVGDKLAVENGFDGIKLALNTHPSFSPNYDYYNVHPHHQREDDFMDKSEKPKKINYDYYTKYYIQDRERSGDFQTVANSVFVNFDNSVRFYSHSESHEFAALGRKIDFITKTKNGGVYQFKEFLSQQFDLYCGPTKEGTSRIFLINAWNEWGEQMTLEPSQEMGFSYLEGFLEELLQTFAGDGRCRDQGKLQN